jgi:hypothetical protein
VRRRAPDHARSLVSHRTGFAVAALAVAAPSAHGATARARHPITVRDFPKWNEVLARLAAYRHPEAPGR